MKTITSLTDIFGKTILVRGDLDVAMNGNEITEAYRLEKMLPTIRYILERQGKIVLCGHLGRPEGNADIKYTLEPIAKWLGNALAMDIPLITQWYETPTDVIQKLDSRSIILLENLRFYPQEEDNDQQFSHVLSSFADIYVNECFSTSTRAHASFVGIPQLLPSYAGLRLAEEISQLKTIRENPERPLVMIMGGGKADTKIPVVTAMSKYANHILLGGKLMFAKELEGVKGVRFPVDAEGIKDIGPKSVTLFAEYIDKAATIVWNGPMGVFEEEQYDKGTRNIAAAILKTSAKKIIGGGDTIAAMNKYGLLDQFDFVSTGGGAMLEYLANETLPGLEALH